MKFKSVEEMKLRLKRTWAEEVEYYLFYAPQNWVRDTILEIKSFIQRGKRGYANADIWDFDVYLAEVIVGGLKQLKKNQQGIPPEIYEKYEKRTDLTKKKADKLAQKEWNTVLDMMIRGFSLVSEMFEAKVFKNKKLKESYEYEFERAMDFFKKYYFSLWD